MSRKVESVLVTKQEIVLLLRVEPTIAIGVPMVVRVRYNEPIFNQQNGNIIIGILRD
jgi:hypothetical protein